jgi:hypothetical protein
MQRSIIFVSTFSSAPEPIDLCALHFPVPAQEFLFV